MSSAASTTKEAEFKLELSEPLDRQKLLRFSVSLVSQGRHRFFTLTMPSDVLAQTCFVTTRDEDPDQGFQRTLSQERAQQIADYIDAGLGTIPTSIVLSAQPDAELRVIGGGKTLEFKPDRKSFLIIDGQHRVFGFAKAKTRLRVPVVIYNGLSKKDESRLFIDINTKQKPVPNELLLDIKKLAEYENDAERVCGTVFDLFHEQPSSPLFGLTSPTSRSDGKISRVTFNAALRQHLWLFASKDAEEVFDILSGYLRAVKSSLDDRELTKTLAHPIFFRAILAVFPDITARVKDKGQKYTTDSYAQFVGPMFDNVSRQALQRPRAVTTLVETFLKASKRDFTL